MPKAVGLLTHFYYNHASIGLDEDMNIFYSFVYEGVIVENITRNIGTDRERFHCLLYELEVSEKAYQSIKEILRIFIENKVSMHYNKIGVALCLFRIPYKRKHHYFCSQFVAAVLEYGRAVRLQKDSSLYLPRDFAALQGVKEKFQGDLEMLERQYRLASSFASII